MTKPAQKPAGKSAELQELPHRLARETITKGDVVQRARNNYKKDAPRLADQFDPLHPAPPGLMGGW